MAADQRDPLERLLRGEHLTEGEARRLMHALAAGDVDPVQAGGLLAALRAKGETADELRGFASVMRELALAPALPPGSSCVDTVGTGGDGSGSVNISTATGLLAAAAGVRVAKHGNRSVSSRCGSSDVLAELGLSRPLDATEVGECLAATGFTFLFSPAFHPAMKSIMPVRTALGVRTVFNMLGPLVNPAKPPFQLIGAFSVGVARLLAEALAGLPIRRAFVVHGTPGWDEATPVGPYHLFDVSPGEVRESVRDPADVGLPRCNAEALAGGDAGNNAAALERVLRGEDRGAYRDAVVLNTGLVLELMGEADTLADGVAAAGAALDDGRGARVLDALATFGRRCAS